MADKPSNEAVRTALADALEEVRRKAEGPERMSCWCSVAVQVCHERGLPPQRADAPGDGDDEEEAGEVSGTISPFCKCFLGRYIPCLDPGVCDVVFVGRCCSRRRSRLR